MRFLPDVYVTCDVCHGHRYNRETLEVKFKGKSIADVLDMTVEDAHLFFKAVPPIRDKMAMLEEVGLGYIKVGQQATTLSGGEAQRVKLAKELSRRATGRLCTFWTSRPRGFTSRMCESCSRCSTRWWTRVTASSSLSTIWR
jgi:excinuclease ABC subunit A